MKLNRYVNFAAVLAIFLSGVAIADPPTTVARLGYLNGAVSFSPAGEDDWLQATINRPLVTGDRLWVANGARAEVQTSNTMVRIAGGSLVSLLNLDDRIVQLEMTRGTMIVRIRRDDPNRIVEVDTPNLALTLRRAGTYRIAVDAADDATTIIVREGSGEVYGNNVAYAVRAGDAYEFYGLGLRDFDRLGTVALDEFDQWSRQRDRRFTASASSRFVSPDVLGYEELDAHGSWRTVASYGPVWFPRRVASGWAPYTDGHWSWVEPWGWTWVDDAPWGFAVSHYGRWAHINGTWGGIL